MKRQTLHKRTAITSYCFIIFAVFTGLSTSQVTNTADEEYFLIRTLEMLYEQWPQNVNDPDAFSAASAELRNEAIKLRVRGESANMSPEIIARYRDFVVLLDSYNDFLKNLGVIRQAAYDEAGKEGFQSGFKGGVAGGTTFAKLSQSEDISSGDAALAAVVVGGLTYAIDSWGKSKRRDQTAQAAVSAAARKIQDDFIETLERSKQSFYSLARSRGWATSEIGWELSETQLQAVLELYRTGDVAGLTREFSRQSKARPRDSFLRLSFYEHQAVQNESDPLALARLAEDSYETLRLIPTAVTYSDYRFNCIFQAAVIASASRDAERRNNSKTMSTKISVRALDLWNEVMQLEPGDSTGYIHTYLAMAKASNGDVKGAYSDVAAVFDRLKSDPDYAYCCAGIYSLGGSFDDSLRFLEFAVKSGAVNVNVVRNDPDFTQLSKNRRESFRKLVTPLWTWKVTDDLIWDDVVFRNDSPFPMSNVTFAVTLKKSGEETKLLNLKCDIIQPGAEKRWIDAVQGVSGIWDKTSTAVLVCDQTLE